MIWLFCSLAMAAIDPWGRPTHARMVIEPPRTLDDLYADTSRFRLWWDETGTPAQVEIRGMLRWKVLAKDVHSGWITPKLPKDAVLRIRINDAQRTSTPLSASRYYGPTDIAGLSAKDSSQLLAPTVLDLHAVQDLWVANYTGGLLQLSETNTTRWTRWDGLPDDRVLSVTQDQNIVWVGTANGLAQIDNGHVRKVWDDELADPYIQTLAAKDGTVWIGTYQGLDSITNDIITHRLPKWSVFSILTDGQNTAVGYEGITYINSQGDISTQDWPGNVSAMAQIDDQLWMATETKGVVASSKAGTEIIWDHPVNAIASHNDHIWFATDANIYRLPQRDIIGTPETVLLSNGPAYDFAQWQARLWLGSSNGLSLLDPYESGDTDIAPVHASQQLLDIYPHEQGLLYSKDDDFFLGTIGDGYTTTVFQHTDETLLSQPKQIRGLEAQLFGLFDNQVRIHQNNEVTILDVEESTIGMTTWLGKIWIATAAGIYKINQNDGGMVLEREADLTDIQEISSDGQSLWIRQSDSISHVTPTLITEYDTPAKVTAVAPAGLTVCVGTEDGLFRFWKGRDQQWEDPLGSQDHDVRITVTLGDKDGGCWMAAEDGTIGHITASGEQQWWHLPEPDPPTITRLVPDHNGMWVLTEEGSWFIW